MYNLFSTKTIKILAISATLSAAPIIIAQTSTGIGETPTEAQIASWNIDINPSGEGLPDGSGDYELGEMVYEEQCAVCHGSFGESVARWPKLAGGDVTNLPQDRSEKTIGSFWPHATTLYDYINRAMPFHNSKTLTPDEVYALTGYILYLNDLVDDDFVADRDFIIAMNDKMPNHNGFYFDDRPDSLNSRCMSDCTDGDITIHSEATAVNVTPEDDKKVDVGNAELPPADSNETTQPTETATTSKAPETADEAPALSEAELQQAQELYTRKCAACHMTGAAGAPKLGDSTAWAPRVAKGLDVMSQNAINGIGAMPAKGGSSDLSDEEMTIITQYMVEMLN